MRTTIEIPDALFKHLKTRAAVEGTTLRDLVVSLVCKGLDAPEQTPELLTTATLPSISLGSPIALPKSKLTNANLNKFLDKSVDA